MEVFVALSLVLANYRMTHRLYDAVPGGLHLIVFYVLKIFITFACHRHKCTAYLLYFVLVVAFAGFYATSGGQDLSINGRFFLFMFFGFLLWSVVPSCTFFWDIHRKSMPTLRWLMWRSTLEIIVACPIGYFFGAVIIVAILFAMGVYPF